MAAVAPLLKWNAAQHATDYEVQVSTSNAIWTTGAPELKVNQTGLTELQLDVDADLAHNQKYYWRVRGRNAAGVGPWSAVWDFTAFQIPDAPVPVGPAPNGVQNVGPNQTLTWTAGARADSYTVQLSQSATFASGVQEFTGITELQKAVTALQPGAAYYWRVKSVNRGGESAWSNAWSFQVIQLSDQVVLIAPANGSDVAI
jgi:predicted phage tail protein